ncbi:MAG: serine/threonine-protein kinase [Salinirussus sp.]
MSRATVGWLRPPAGGEPTAVSDVTAVLPDPPKNGRYPGRVRLLCSALVVVDYLLVATAALVLAAVLSALDVPLPGDRAGSLLTLLGLVAAVHAGDVVVSRWRRSPIDAAVEALLDPFEESIRHRLIRRDTLPPQESVATARPTPVTGFGDQDDPAASDDGVVTTMWGSLGSFPPEEREGDDLPFTEGDRFQSYRLGPRAGRGALSVVWRAESVDTGETVALKIFDRSVDADTRRTFEADFLHEAKVLRSLRDHEHVITLRDWGYDPTPWIAVEYVEAGTVRDHLPVSLPAALTILLAVTEAIEYAHEQDVSHTDLKPENVLYSEEYFGRLVLVTDWGKRPVVNPELEPMLTRPYAAPEQFDALPTNEPEAERIDIYQLGMLGYELFTGTQPFAAGDDQDTEQRVRTEVPPPPSDYVGDIPAGLDDALLRAISKSPADRHPTVAAFRTDLLDAVLPETVPGE